MSKLMLLNEAGQLVPLEWGNGYLEQDYSWGRRILCSTQGDRIDFLLRQIVRSSGPYHLTYVLEDNSGVDVFRRGRYISNSPLTLEQIKFFLEDFGDFIVTDGRHHLMVHCQSTGCAVVYDQHDYFYIYGQVDSTLADLRRDGYLPREYDLGRHAHYLQSDVEPLHRLMQFRPWRWSDLEATDTSRERVGLWQYVKMKARAKWWDRTRKPPK